MHRNFYRESQLIQRHQLLNEVLFILIFEILPFELNPIFFAQHVFFDRFHLTNVNLVFFKGLHKVLVFLNPFLPFFLFIFYFSFFFIHFRFPQLCSLCSEHWTCSVHAVNINAIFNACICERRKKSLLPTKCSIQNFPNRQ